MELTLDNFAEMYKKYVWATFYRSSHFMITPNDFINIVRKKELWYRGKPIHTRLVSVKYDANEVIEFIEKCVSDKYFIGLKTA